LQYAPRRINLARRKPIAAPGSIDPALTECRAPRDDDRYGLCGRRSALEPSPERKAQSALAQIVLSGLARYYAGGVAALLPLDLSIPAGELLVVLGPSGSGKTTLLRLIAGLIKPSAGGVFIDGHDVTGLPPHHRGVAMVFQHPAVYPHLSVFDNIAFGLRARRIARSHVRARVNTMAGILELDHLLSRRPGQLSGGERQRVALGRALVRQPRVVLLDEPFSNLDQPLRANLREQVVELQRRFGTTLVHVTHDQGEALTMGDRVAVFDRGRMVQAAAPRVLYDHPADRFVAAFVGNPPINILPCHVQAEPEGETVHIHPIGAEGSLRWTVPRRLLPASWDETQHQLELGIRSEALSVREPGGVDWAGPTSLALPARVRSLEFNGALLLATLTVGPHRLVARLTPTQKLAVRDTVTVTVELSRVRWFDPGTGAALEPKSCGNAT
jgi:multiple sugar transport system ATP-binding protein